MTKKYEMFFVSEPGDDIKIDGWRSIDVNRLSEPERLQEFISAGIIREYFYCKDLAEGNDTERCSDQCGRCGKYEEELNNISNPKQ
jgi:hypothetical protein